MTYRGHQHHAVAAQWLDSVRDGKLYFCRLTQIAYLRLMTQSRVMGDEVTSQQKAWNLYDAWLSDPRVFFQVEPEQSEIEREFRRLASSRQPAPQQWSDAYLSAFSSAAGFTLVIFDRALRRMSGGKAVLLS